MSLQDIFEEMRDEGWHWPGQRKQLVASTAELPEMVVKSSVHPAPMQIESDA